jgi:hypothetical protein
MMAAATRKVLLVDHSKFRRRSTHNLAALSDFDAVVVDSDIDERELAAMREHGVHVEVAENAAAGIRSAHDADAGRRRAARPPPHDHPVRRRGGVRRVPAS